MATSVEPDIDLSYLLDPLQAPSDGPARARRTASRRRLARRTVGVAAAFVALLGAAALAGGVADDDAAPVIADDGRAALDRILAAPDATRAAGTYRFTVVPDDLAAVGGSVAGAIDIVNDRSTYVIEGAPSSRPLGFEQRRIGDVLYARSEIGFERPWLRVDLSTLPPEARVTADLFSLFIEPLRATTDARGVGEDVVRDVPVQVYEFTVSAERMLELEAFQAIVRAAGDDFDRDELPDFQAGRVWLDADGRIRRVRFDGLSEGAGVMELFDFGLPVDIAEPPPDQVADDTEERSG